MTFSINQLDNIDSCSEEADEELKKYIDPLLEQFCASPERKEYLPTDLDVGFWPAEFIYYGFRYVGVTLPCIEIVDVEEIITDLFPRKIILDSPEQADNAIPELLAFWNFLKREFKLQNADNILKYLSEIKLEFKNIMYDSSRFSFSKSFMNAGQEAGFDMTKESDCAEFTALYNASVSSQPQEHSSGYLGSPAKHKTKKDNNKKKLRKIANASRKKNRKRK